MARKITRDELLKMFTSKKEFKLVDVLSSDSYEKEHIEGALSMPLEEMETKASQLLKKDDTIVVYCASFDCKASTMAAEKLMAMGFKDVLDYKGGLKDWKEANLALEGSMHEEYCGNYCCCD